MNDEIPTEITAPATNPDPGHPNISRVLSFDEVKNIFAPQFKKLLLSNPPKLGIIMAIQKEDDFTLVEEHLSKAMVPNIPEPVVLDTKWTFATPLQLDVKQITVSTNELDTALTSFTQQFQDNKLTFVGYADGEIPMFGRVNRRHYHIRVGNVSQEEYNRHLQKAQANWVENLGKETPKAPPTPLPNNDKGGT